jgi:hypothetical protein
MYRFLDKNTGVLFASQDLGEFLRQKSGEMTSEVESIDSNRILNTAPADLSSYLVDKYKLEAPTLRRDEWQIDQKESKKDVSRDPNRWFRDQTQPFYVPSQQIRVEVPFAGDPNFFYVRPSQFNLNPPLARIQEGLLVITYEVAHDEQLELRPQIDRALAEIDQHLEWIRKDVNGFNLRLENDALQAIAYRRQRLLQNQNRMVALGIPLRVRPNAPATYAVPTVRRKVAPVLPPASETPYSPEPALDNENYEHILKVIQNMAHVMERSPSAFKEMGEEDLRQHFLVQLNGQFEGNATAETFNAGGKTDILLRVNDRNVFIAECKFWKGPRHFSEAIDQLLSYAAWRDTKTALLVFNRGTGLTTVLAGIKEALETHSNFKRPVAWAHESGYRYVFSHREDPNRELIVTAIIFNVPQPRKDD